MSADRRHWADQLVVVTGGLGFLGSNLVHHLLREGARVRVIDALVNGHGGDPRNIPAGVDVLTAPVGDAACADVVRDADVVFNLAGQVSHLASMRDPLADLEWNTLTHARFLEQVRTHAPAARVVHASTRQVYGRPIRSLVDEDHPVNPVDVNGVAKFAGEQLHLVYARAYDLSTISLRFTNLYGPRQRLSSDELGVLPVFIRKALLGEDIALFGDGSQRRDCLFVADAVEALCRAAECTTSAVVNVGHQQDYSLAEIAELVVDVAGTTSTVSTQPWPADHQRLDIGSVHTDGSLAARVLGWSATTSLADGLAATIDFYRAHPWYLSST